MSSQEFVTRLQHLVNTMQCVVLNSGLADYNDRAWQIGREYDHRVAQDVLDGVKSWSSLSSSLQADCYVFARDCLNNKSENKPDKAGPKKDKEQKTPLPCRDYNTKSNDGELCSWEVENVGKRCNRLHVCATCAKSGAQRTHRAFECSAASKNSAPFNPQGSGP